MSNTEDTDPVNDDNTITSDTSDASNSSKKRRRRRRKKKSSPNGDNDDSKDPQSTDVQEEDENVQHLTMEEIHTLFLSDHKIMEHLEALRTDRHKYLDQIRLFVKFSVMEQLTTSTKAKILCVLLIENEREFTKWIMTLSQFFSVGEIAKCIQLLDAPRKVRQYRRKLVKLEAAKQKKRASVRDKTLTELRTTIHNLEQDPHPGSLNGSKCRFLLKWINTVPQERLEFFLLNFGTANWKIICDLIHPKPSRDFQCDYFQKAVFEGTDGTNLPENSLVRRAQMATKDNIVDLLQQYPYLSQCYSYLRRKLLPSVDQQQQSAVGQDTESKVQSLISLGFSRHEALCALNRNYLNLQNAAEWLFDENNKAQCTGVDAASYYRHDMMAQRDQAIPAEAKHIISENAPLETVVWWYDELHSAEVEMEVMERLQTALERNEEIFKDDSARSNYGKLMERILSFRDRELKFVPDLIRHAQRRLESVAFDRLNDGNSFLQCAVLGDASGSMEVAIRSSCIIASLLSVALSADLRFFNEHSFKPQVVPRDVDQTVKVIDEISARGGTCMASAIWPFLRDKIKIDLFVLVSDEGENERHQNQYFHEMFASYKEEVNPKVRLFLVSFVKVGEEGLILSRLREHNKVDMGCIKQFRLHPEYPDTSKFQALLGMIALQLAAMKEHFYAVARCLEDSYDFEEMEADKVSNIICSFL